MIASPAARSFSLRYSVAVTSAPGSDRRCTTGVAPLAAGAADGARWTTPPPDAIAACEAAGTVAAAGTARRPNNASSGTPADGRDEAASRAIAAATASPIAPCAGSIGDVEVSGNASVKVRLPGATSADVPSTNGCAPSPRRSHFIAICPSLSMHTWCGDRSRRGDDHAWKLLREHRCSSSFAIRYLAGVVPRGPAALACTPAAHPRSRRAVPARRPSSTDVLRCAPSLRTLDRYELMGRHQDRTKPSVGRAWPHEHRSARTADDSIQASHRAFS